MLWIPHSFRMEYFFEKSVHLIFEEKINVKWSSNGLLKLQIYIFKIYYMEYVPYISEFTYCLLNCTNKKQIKNYKYLILRAKNIYLKSIGINELNPEITLSNIPYVWLFYYQLRKQSTVLYVFLYNKFLILFVFIRS